MSFEDIIPNLSQGTEGIHGVSPSLRYGRDDRSILIEVIEAQKFILRYARTVADILGVEAISGKIKKLPQFMFTCASVRKMPEGLAMPRRICLVDT